MNHKALLQMGAELAFSFRHGQGSADRALAEYVKEKRFLGATDRAFLGNVFFHMLRHLRRIDESIESAFFRTLAAEQRFSTGFPVYTDEGARAWSRLGGYKKGKPLRQSNFDRVVDTLRLGLAMVELGLDTPETLAEEVERAWPKLKEKPVIKPESFVRMATRAAEVAELYKKPRRAVDADRSYSFPSWLWSLLGVGRDPGETMELGAALNGQAPTTLRVNTLKTTPEEAIAALEEKGIAFKSGRFLAEAVLLDERIGRGNLPHFADGWFEMQDEGSQLVSVYTGAAPGMAVIDACAGGGGKSLHLAALMRNEGTLLAFDKAGQRLVHLPRRAARGGAEIVRIDEKMPPAESADIVLVDVPCSGTGTLRRNPENKWRMSTPELERLRETQLEIAEKWAPIVKPGGHLVYATCSLLAHENREQVDRFCQVHRNFYLDPPDNFKGPMTHRGELETLPHRDGCDGLYAARLKKKA